LVHDLHAPVESALFRKVTDSILHLSIDLAAEKQDASGVGRRDVYDHPDRCGFPGAIRPKQSENPSRAHRQAKLFNRCKLTKTLADAIELYRYVVSCHVVVL
jgi:hypothetical protein